MQEEKGLVSVIIPVYNTGVILTETVNSVLNQPYTQVELLLIDDGSPDQTLSTIILPNDDRVIKIWQDNQGMARSRNNGLAKARGEFIFFLDHDDIIEPDFITERINYLHLHPETGFAGGPIKTFPNNIRYYTSAAVNVEEEVLFFNPSFLTTPSSYIFRKSVLDNHGIRMNEKLSSTADRFFLLQLSKVTSGGVVNKGALLYRISAGGFSQIIKAPLIYDNELFYTELKKYDLLPSTNTSWFKCQYFWGLGIGFFKVKKYYRSLKYLTNSFTSSPKKFIQIILKKLFSKQ